MHFAVVVITLNGESNWNNRFANWCSYLPPRQPSRPGQLASSVQPSTFPDDAPHRPQMGILEKGVLPNGLPRPSWAPCWRRGLCATPSCCWWWWSCWCFLRGCRAAFVQWDLFVGACREKCRGVDSCAALGTGVWRRTHAFSSPRPHVLIPVQAAGPRTPTLAPPRRDVCYENCQWENGRFQRTA